MPSSTDVCQSDLRVWWFKQMVSCLLGLYGDTEFLAMLDSDKGVSSSLFETRTEVSIIVCICPIISIVQCIILFTYFDTTGITR